MLEQFVSALVASFQYSAINTAPASGSSAGVGAFKVMRTPANVSIVTVRAIFVGAVIDSPIRDRSVWVCLDFPAHKYPLTLAAHKNNTVLPESVLPLQVLYLVHVFSNILNKLYVSICMP